MTADTALIAEEWLPITLAFQFLERELGSFGAAAHNLRSALAAGYLDSIAICASDDDRLVLSRQSWEAPALSDAGHPIWSTGHMDAFGDGFTGGVQRSVFIRCLQVMDLFRVSARREKLDRLAALSGWIDIRDVRSGEPADRHDDPPSQTIPQERWTDARMREAIAQCACSNRDEAWRKLFKPLQHEHGWKLQSFRDEWSSARGTKGHKGRLPS